MTNIDRTEFEEEALRRMRELYNYCAANQIPLVCNMLFERTVLPDGSMVIFNRHTTMKKWTAISFGLAFLILALMRMAKSLVDKSANGICQIRASFTIACDMTHYQVMFRLSLMRPWIG